ncbi:MAG: tryptophan-rich sensory protein [Candidatus Hermodarchaeota archaeon]
MEFNKRNILIIGNLVTLFLALIMNFLSNALPLNGKTAGELSDSYPNLFVPAGYVFAIWGIIYVFLIIFGIYQALPQNKDKQFQENISFYFILSNIANATWLFFWHFEYILLSVLTMLVLLLSLIMIYLRLGIGVNQVERNEKLAVHTLFSIYLGWITVATVANVTALLVSLSWDGLGINEEIWTWIVLAIATAIVLTVTVTRRDIVYGLVPVWAFIGILVKQLDNSPSVAIGAGLFAGIIFIVLVITSIQSYRKVSA